MVIIYIIIVFEILTSLCPTTDRNYTKKKVGKLSKYLQCVACTRHLINNYYVRLSIKFYHAVQKRNNKAGETGFRYRKKMVEKIKGKVKAEFTPFWEMGTSR
jgi:hypothetical protein